MAVTIFVPENFVSLARWLVLSCFRVCLLFARSRAIQCMRCEDMTMTTDLGGAAKLKREKFRDAKILVNRKKHPRGVGFSPRNKDGDSVLDCDKVLSRT